MGSSGIVPPAGTIVRPAGRGDIAVIDALYRRSDVALGVRPESRVGYFEWRWSHPWVHLGRDTRVLEREGGLVGYAEQYHHGDDGPVQANARVDPELRGRGVGAWLLDWFIGAATDRGAPVVRTACPASDADAAMLLVDRGFAQVRVSIDMGRSLDGDLPSPAPPEGVRIRPFVDADRRDLWRVSSESFRDHWDHVQVPTYETFVAEWFPEQALSPRILLAEAAGEVVGEAAWTPEAGYAYVFSVGVLASHRRRGIAGALLRTAIADAHAEGLANLSLSVDAESPTGAVGVYERAGLERWRTMFVFDRSLP